MKRLSRLIILGVVGAIFLSRPGSSDAKTVPVMRLAPGNYTAIVRGANNTTGVALVEAFQLQ